jgi:hypothetical protein
LTSLRRSPINPPTMSRSAHSLSARMSMRGPSTGPKRLFGAA